MAIEKGLDYKDKYKLDRVDESDLYKRPFRGYFIKDNDKCIAMNLSNYFSAIEQLWPQAWDKSSRESSLNKTIGFIALMRILKDILQVLIDESGFDFSRVLSTDEYYSILDGGVLSDDDFMELDATSKSTKVIYELIKENLVVDFE